MMQLTIQKTLQTDVKDFVKLDVINRLQLDIKDIVRLNGQTGSELNFKLDTMKETQAESIISTRREIDEKITLNNGNQGKLYQ